jgi:2-polyprenyl-3-methyl-5-hydroxy-6-metoxy-1,4-benzoquinol methylase
MRSDANILIDHISDVIQYYQDYMVKTRYPKDRYVDPIWKQNNKAGSFGFVPSRGIIQLTRAFKAVFDYLTKRVNEDLSFLDAGCGVGNMLLLAHSVGFIKVGGIEFDEKTARIARKLLKCTINEYDYKIVKADLKKYNKYEDYNVIYYYQPLHVNCMPKFLDLLGRNMKVGAVVIVNGRDPFGEDRKFKRILKSLDVLPIDGIYEKVK